MNRWMSLSFTLLLLSGLSAAQANGEATVVSGYATTGAYSAPIVPLVNTPSISLEGPPLQVGISDRTQAAEVGVANSATSERFDLGAARSDDSYGAAELASRFHPAKAARIYTNQDVAQVNDTNGLVRFGNKTEHL
jgi:hypothetical protein